MMRFTPFISFPQDENAPPVSFFEVMRLNISEWPYILVGAVSAMINGVMPPAFSFLFATIIGVGVHSICGSQKVVVVTFIVVLFYVNPSCWGFFHIVGVYKSRSGIHQAKMSVPLLDVCCDWMRVLNLRVSTGMQAQTHTYPHTYCTYTVWSWQCCSEQTCIISEFIRKVHGSFVFCLYISNRVFALISLERLWPWSLGSRPLHQWWDR